MTDSMPRRGLPLANGKRNSRIPQVVGLINHATNVVDALPDPGKISPLSIGKRGLDATNCQISLATAPNIKGSTAAPGGRLSWLRCKWRGGESVKVWG
ncbi:hypothetical protein B0G75_12414 [Paraburkholderia sp. BL18I3N2]|nr:hypothetical protein B0G75_12414 [Paraburkholderia sp. BL18I3N2]PRX95949.1 hypothetical protein B0G73_13158 [Paraburkholderia sp. BL25I1N1]